MVPLLLDKVSVVLFVPEQTVAAPLIEPATEVELIDIVTLVVVAEAQAPLVTTAL